MNDFHPGDKVLFDNPYTPLVGTVTDIQRIGDRTGCIVDLVDNAPRSEPFHIWADRLIKLPADALILRRGSQVRVYTDAPFCAGQYGTVAAPELHDDLFGYWLDMDGDRHWILADALDPQVPVANGGESR